ncbi:calcium/sodium antiporter [Patescibacteria group bacterium]|nr:calcium/sodium antiporter [Patescibacteria group bacterium]
MDTLMWLGIFLIALIALIKSADYFTTSAERIGVYFKIPPFIIGVTIIALGTSLPELATSIISVMKGSSEIVIGNVVGSNIANILLVLGIAAIVGKHLYVSKEIKNIDLPLVLASSILLFLTTIDGIFNYKDAIVGLLLFVGYMVYNVKSHRSVEDQSLKDVQKLKKEAKEEVKLAIKYPFILIASAIALYFAADYTVVAIIKLGEIFKIGNEVIALSAVAVGTSLPELVVSVVAAKKGKADIAIGNITGSNIFNALAVMGIPAFFGQLTIPPEIISFSIPTLLFVTILYMFTTIDKEITKWEGMALVAVYIAFVGKTFGII